MAPPCKVGLRASLPYRSWRRAILTPPIAEVLGDRRQRPHKGPRLVWLMLEGF